ncbi:MAG: DNA helicase RecQ [Candidatus Susulua stagnicola]|nr:DNA helicase RecQ [Candidatus Susulua stagnicola]
MITRETEIDREQLYEALQQYWGYDSFLPLQEETINSILSNQDSLTILPTGGGKSLCFQLPALLKEGMAVVISPLISLMKDQVDSLRDIGISSCCLNSSMPYEEQRLAIEQIYNGEIKLLYISPERLQNETTLGLLRTIKLSFFVIDEAHCISHWGHDFRSDYRNLSVIKKEFESVSVHTFTATATIEVQRDIVVQLGFTDYQTHVGQIDRPNLTYRALPRKQILKQITDVLEKHTYEAGIIYCLRRKDVEKISKDLKRLGIDNVGYHAGMSDKKRHRAQERFSLEKVNIVVATIAFGMGIDRSNIRFIIHAGMPKSIEHYQQETGRAGRDRLSAFCYMFYSGADYQLWNFFAAKSPNRKVLMTKLNSIYNFCTQPQCRHKVLANYFGQDYSDSQCGACDYCLNELDMVKDAISVGQKVLYCVDAVRQGDYGFGAGYVTNILKGKLTERIESMDHDSLSTFAIMADESESFIRHIIEQLVGQGFLDKDENFSTLSVTGTGNMLLQGKASLVLAKPLIASKKKESKRKAAKRKVSEWADVDEDLFQLLREKRAEISQSKGVPAYIIFSDKTLIDMATKKPLTHEAFSELYGVGEKKLKTYADIFIEVIK